METPLFTKKSPNRLQLFIDLNLSDKISLAQIPTPILELVNSLIQNLNSIDATKRGVKSRVGLSKANKLDIKLSLPAVAFWGTNCWGI